MLPFNIRKHTKLLINVLSFRFWLAQWVSGASLSGFQPWQSSWINPAPNLGPPPKWSPWWGQSCPLWVQPGSPLTLLPRRSPAAFAASFAPSQFSPPPPFMPPKTTAQESIRGSKGMIKEGAPHPQSLHPDARSHRAARLGLARAVSWVPEWWCLLSLGWQVVQYSS